MHVHFSYSMCTFNGIGVGCSNKSFGDFFLSKCLSSAKWTKMQMRYKHANYGATDGTQILILQIDGTFYHNNP
jgi:hypothetical protein